ncbi:hypothetical protein GCM10017602_18110 [Herbiconiux flava]|nr:hypothetical protein GCM10017602_18110 [Herbiconiux flava]
MNDMGGRNDSIISPSHEGSREPVPGLIAENNRVRLSGENNPLVKLVDPFADCSAALAFG